MKAKEYFAKYDELIVNEQSSGAIEIAKQLLDELSKEAVSICEARNVKRNSAVVSVLKELNQKWNAICSLYEKKYGASPLKRDAFGKVWEHIMPELTGKLTP